MPMLRSLARWLVSAAGSVLLGLVLIALALYWHFLRSGPEPKPWHEVALADFTTADAGEVVTLSDYRKLEDRLFADLLDKVYAKTEAADRSPFNRFNAGSRSDPGVWPVNWNRSYHLEPTPAGATPRGAALLLHGLTDSPYSLRSIGEHLASRGFEVVGLRLPGHGTAPSGLVSFRIEDMQAAVRLAMLDLRRQIGPEQPIYLVGYSNGAALAVDYTLSALEGEALPRPAGLVLVSPAIAISRFAALAQLRTGLSSVPGFERAAWQVIETEFDPYKYNSFSFNAAGETHRLTTRVTSRVRRLAEREPIRGFPPVLIFLSAVDSTVLADAVVDALLKHLAPEGHELVLFDVNRYSMVQSLLVNDPGPLTQRLLALPARPFGLTVITNATPQTLQVRELRAPAGSSEQQVRLLDLAWPRTVFSLSHVALPFPPDDPLYGYEPAPVGNHVQLGRIEVRGENGVLALPMWALTRQRSNPFHSYLLERIDGFVADDVPQP
jgi:alpha-beta hydrolase superfamily lysophospholipase